MSLIKNCWFLYLNCIHLQHHCNYCCCQDGAQKNKNTCVSAYKLVPHHTNWWCNSLFSWLHFYVHSIAFYLGYSISSVSNRDSLPFLFHSQPSNHSAVVRIIMESNLLHTFELKSNLRDCFFYLSNAHLRKRFILNSELTFAIIFKLFLSFFCKNVKLFKLIPKDVLFISELKFRRQLIKSTINNRGSKYALVCI